MAGGMFDLHTLLALKQGWTAIAADEELFKGLFRTMPGGDFSLPEAALEEWHAKLAPDGAADGVSFREMWAPDQPTLPQVVVQLQDEPHETQPLGFFGGIADDGRESLEDVVVEQVTISMFVAHPELLRALYVAVRAIMLSSVAFFLGAGYASLEYVKGGDFRPAWEPMPEGLGVLFRQQQWRTISQPFFTAPELSRKAFIVAAADVTVDGVSGGVTPEE